MGGISTWGLQLCIVKNYNEMGIQELFNWQVECLNTPGILDGKNLVFSAPTSAGKTLVVEILLLKRLQNTGKKVIFILPYVSLVKEKTFSLQQLVEGTGIRVDGCIGGTSLQGGFSTIDVAICTIEKANNLINRLIEEKKLHKLGMIVVDELHMVSDKSRGYLLELLLTKVRFLSLCKALTLTHNYDLQIVGMSATVPNLNLLSDWLDAALYQTAFRPVPLQRCIKIGNDIFDEDFKKLRTFISSVQFYDDQNQLTSLCHETLSEGDSVLIFCPTKHWCEKLSNLIARNFHCLNSNPLEQKHHVKLDAMELQRIVEHLKRLSSGLDDTLKLTIPFSVAFHHAGLTTEERDVIESGFRRNIIRVLVATSTLSSGVNLPAKRVIIRTPMFHRSVINSLSYQQMAGRAGRKGKNRSGESILICQQSERKKVEVLCKNQLAPIQSCLNTTPNNSVTKSMKRAILEVIVNGIACAVSDILLYIKCTLLSSQLKYELKQGDNSETIDIEIIKECLLWLKEYEFIHMESNLDGVSQNEDILSAKLSASQFGRAALLSSLPTCEALQVLADLRMASKNLVLDTELHLVYQITPLNSLNEWHNLNWMDYLRIYEGLPSCLLRVAEIVGINEGFITRLATCGNSLTHGKLSEKRLRQLNIHTRFYSALALHDLVNEAPLDVTCKKFNCNRGMLQSLQHSASSFAGMVTTFCQQLGWWSLELLFKEFQCRLVFGIQHELVDLTKISVMKREYARVLYESGYTTCEVLACAKPEDIAAILRNSTKFQSIRKDVLNDALCDNDEIKTKPVLLFGSNICLNEEEAAIKFIQQAQIIHPLVSDEVPQLSQKRDVTFSSQAFLQQLSQSVPQQHVSFPSPDNHRENDAINGTENCGDDDVSLASTMSIEKRGNSDIIFYLSSETSPPPTNNNETFEFTFGGSEKINDENDTNSSALNSPDIFKKKVHENEEKISTLSNNKSPTSSFTSTHAKIENNQVEYRNSMTESQIVCMFEKGFNQSDENLEPYNEYSAKKDTVTARLLINERLDQKIMKKAQNFPVHSCEFGTPKAEKNVKACDMKKEVYFSPKLNNNPCILLSSTPILNNSSSQIQHTQIIDNSHDILGSKSPDVSNLSELFSKSFSLAEKSDNMSCDLFNNTSNDDNVQQKLPLRNSTGLEVSLNNMHLNGNRKSKNPEDTKKLLFSEVIVNVCASKELFSCFIQEWAKQNIAGMALIKANSKDGKNDNVKDIVIGIAVCWNSRTCFYVSLKKDENSPNSLTNRVSKISKILHSSKNWICAGHNIKEQIKPMLLLFGMFPFRKWKDSYIADWLLNPDNLNDNFESLMKKYCTSYTNINNGIAGRREANEIKIACREAMLSLNSVVAMDSLITEQNMLNSYQNIEIPHVISLSILEMNGIGVDIKTFKNYNAKLFKYLRELQNEAWKIAGHKFNLNSASEVAKVLYGELGLKPSTETLKLLSLKKSHYKYWGTNKVILTELTEQPNPHPLPMVIMQWRSLHYSLYKVLHPISSRINLDTEDIQFFSPSCVACTSTGRISMNEPNIQNIPRSYSINLPYENLKLKTQEQISLRNVFVPNHGNVFISADYSQLELRILAHMSKDDLLLSTLNRSDGVDVFKLIAVSICEDITKTDDVTSEKRQMAKQICYGIIYGMGANSLSRQMKKSEAVAANFIEGFMKMYSKVSVFLQNTVRRCKEKGYITTLSGRRRYLPDIKSVRIPLRGHAERQAVNSVIQGSAADLVKSATNAIITEAYKRKWNILRHENKSASVENNCYFVHQIHDELIFEASHSMVHEVCLLMHKCMTSCMELNVKLKANFKVGPSWGQLENYEFTS